MSKHTRLWIPAILTTLLAGCTDSQTRTPVSGTIGGKCPPPPASVFTKYGVTVKLAEANIGDVLFGGVDIRSRPEVQSLVSAAAMESEIWNYMACLALHRDGYTRDVVLATEQRRMDISAYLSTSPTPDQFREFLEKLAPIPRAHNSNKTTSDSDIVNAGAGKYPVGEARDFKIVVTDCRREGRDVLLRFDLVRIGRFDTITIQAKNCYALDEHNRKAEGSTAWIDGGSSGSSGINATRRKFLEYTPVAGYVRFRNVQPNAATLREVGIKTVVGSGGRVVELSDIPIQ